MTQENKTIVARWFKEFWGNPWNPRIINELATADILLHYPMHEPKKGRASVTKFMMDFREAFPDLNFQGIGNLIAEGNYVVGRWEGGGTHTGLAFCDFRIGLIPAASGRKMKFAGTSVLRVEQGRIAEAFQRVTTEICYCSALDDCWLLNNQEETKAISKCPMERLTFKN